MNSLNEASRLILEGKNAAEQAIMHDNDGNVSDALRLYRCTIRKLEEGCDYEQDPDAIATVRSKIASFYRRITELESVVVDDKHSGTSPSAPREFTDIVNQDENDGIGRIATRFGDSSESEREDDEKSIVSKKLVHASWSQEPDIHTRDSATVPFPPSAQLTASQEGLQNLLRSKDRLEAQIQEARLRAETYTRGLEEARRAAYTNSVTHAAQSSLDIETHSDTHFSSATFHGVAPSTVWGEDSSLGTENTETDHTNIAVLGGPQVSPRVLALERLIKVQQRELIIVNTDLRVSHARNAALTQKLGERYDADGSDAIRRQFSAADVFVSSLKEQMVEMEQARREAEALSKALAVQLAAAKQRCVGLQRDLAAATLTGSGPVVGATPETNVLTGEMECISDSAIPRIPGTSRLTQALSLPEARGDVWNLAPSGASSITTDASASVSILKQWRNQAQNRLALKAREGTGVGKFAANNRSPKTGSPKVNGSPKVTGSPKLIGSPKTGVILKGDKALDLANSMPSNDLLGTGALVKSRVVKRGDDGRGDKGGAAESILLQSQDRVDHVIPKTARRGTRPPKRSGEAASGIGLESEKRKALVAKRAVTSKVDKQKAKSAALATRVSFEEASLQAAKAQAEAEARSKLIRAKVLAQNAVKRGGNLAKRLSHSVPVTTPPRRAHVKIVVPAQIAQSSTSTSTARPGAPLTRKARSGRMTRGSPSTSLFGPIGDKDLQMLSLSLESGSSGGDAPMRFPLTSRSDGPSARGLLRSQR